MSRVGGVGEKNKMAAMFAGGNRLGLVHSSEVRNIMHVINAHADFFPF